MTRKLIGPALEDYLREHAGTPLHITRISVDTGYDEQQVSNALSHLAENSTSPVVRPRRGVYMYPSQTSAAPTASLQAAAETFTRRGSKRLLPGSTLQIVGEDRDGNYMVLLPDNIIGKVIPQ